ncbi:MAG: Zn-dependent peptidase ImmA (M78 family), partial [Candidatus Deianiraeaceae bacterium]
NGIAGYFDDSQKTIFINEKYSATRNLFTIAHEIGHFILHTGSNNRFDEYHKYTDAERKREYEANAFAGKLLMPENKFVEVFKKYKGDFYKILKKKRDRQDEIETKNHNMKKRFLQHIEDHTGKIFLF